MNAPRIFSVGILLVGAAASAAACGGSGTSEPPVDLQGTYVASGPGEYQSMTFLDAVHYSVVLSSCSDSDCTRKGNYYLDASHDLLALEDGTTHRITEIEFRYFQTGGSSVSLGRDTLHTLGEGEPLTNGVDAALTNGADASLVYGTDASLVYGSDASLVYGTDASLAYPGGALTFDGGALYVPNSQLIPTYTANGQPFQAGN